MKTTEQCMECFLHQMRSALKLAGISAEEHDQMLKDMSIFLGRMDMSLTPPEIAAAMYGHIHEFSSSRDLYKDIKKRNNDQVLSVYTILKDKIAASSDPLLMALRLAAAGNVIDYGIPHEFDIMTELDKCAKTDFAIFHYEQFKERLASAGNILYILDNAGEIVLDKLLMTAMKKNIIAAVRSAPIINDATIEDAEQAGLHDVCKVIASGSSAPGTIMDKATPEFRKAFDSSDLIISKGQGNYETLEGLDEKICFIFKAKCSVVALHAGVSVGDPVLTFFS